MKNRVAHLLSAPFVYYDAEVGLQYHLNCFTGNGTESGLVKRRFGGFQG